MRTDIFSIISDQCAYADMAELADALDLGSSGSHRVGSSPTICIYSYKGHKDCK